MFFSDGRAWLRRGRTDTSFSCPPRQASPDLCLVRISHLPKVGDAANPHTQTHLFTLPLTPTHNTLTYAHHAHVGPRHTHSGRNLIPSFPSRLLSAGHVYCPGPMCVPGPHPRSAESSEMRMCVYL